MASIPVEVRYDNPVKRGWSLYGRLGGVVSALLGVRSEVEGAPEATRTYSLASSGRRLTAGCWPACAAGRAPSSAPARATGPSRWGQWPKLACCP